jgi:sec-independent protein translocase protein TatA
MFGKIGMGELLIILAVVLLIFGPSKLPALARSMGQAMKEFRKGTQEVQDGLNQLSKDVMEDPKPQAQAQQAAPKTDAASTSPEVK